MSSERLLLAIVAVLVAVIVGVAVLWQPDAPAPAAPPTLPAGGEFTLQSADGPVSLKDFRGRVTLLYFGYTYCPDICPTTLSALTAGLAQLTPEERARVAVVFISVDPQRDTPEHLKTYVAFFDPGFVGVTGSPAELGELAGRYGVFYQRQPGGKDDAYIVDHTAETFAVGPDGRLLARMAHGTPPDQVTALIRQYLNQP